MPQGKSPFPRMKASRARACSATHLARGWRSFMCASPPLQKGSLSRLELGEEGRNLRTPKLAADDLLPLRIDAVGVKNVLSDIETDRGWLHHLTSSISCRENHTGLRA